MLFSSPVFLFAFLPVVYLINLKCSVNSSNIVLVIASLFFYAWGEPLYLLLLLGSVAVNFLLTRLMVKSHGKPFFLISVIFNLGLLVIFKYTGFFMQIVNSATGWDLPLPDIRLPLGISFYTFQIMSYVIDLYRGRVNLQKSYVKLLLYVSLFPQLIAGPIVKYKEIDMQLSERKPTAHSTAEGIRRFIWGLSKKVLIANTFAVPADKIFSMPQNELNITIAWIGALSYAIQIYYDFSGYSDMAIGMGRMFGFNFPINFNYPYISANIHEFWKRWHISLSSWFREYLYFPLGGNRKGKFRTAFNRLTVFFFTGLWHGANFTFIVWGLFHGLFLMLETVGVIRQPRGRLKPLSHIYTMLIVTVGFVIFRADTLTHAGYFIKNMLAGFNFTQGTAATAGLILNPLLITCFVLAVIFSTPAAGILARKFEKIKGGKTAIGLLSGGVSLCLYILCILNLSASGYNPFIYFRF